MNTEPTQSEEVVKNFQVDEEVLAKWTDSKFYPATIIEIQNDFCKVLFEDGYQKKVKLSALKKIPADYERAQLPSDSEEEQSEYFSVNPSNLSAFACNICSKVFRKERFLLQHIKNYHSKEEKKSERQPSSSSHHREQRKQQGQRNAVSSTTAST
ncbi:PREDICTED: PHD finger protein 20-like protein 1, partial [Rhagoletis zephyria]|uniref:PHD finger protein 20-like protein 1 n=1 Tax=Rhagoletis zephyria TaxID=28612 RepID=UPI0008113501